MKPFRTLVSIPLALMSLMNLGYPFGADPKPDIVLAVAIVALGLAGVGAVFGLIRDTRWGVPAALAVAGVNVVAAIIGLVNDSDGAAIGLVVSVIALALAMGVASSRRTASAALTHHGTYRRT